MKFAANFKNGYISSPKYFAAKTTANTQVNLEEGQVNPAMWFWHGFSYILISQFFAKSNNGIPTTRDFGDNIQTIFKLEGPY